MIYTPQEFDKQEYPDIRDNKDLPILVSAIIGDVDYLITGDKDFFEIKLEKPEIVSAKEFLDNY